MAKWANDLFMDAALDYIKDNCDVMVVCSAQPATYAEATTTYDLADVAMASGDFTHANGDTNGRKTTVAAKDDVTVNHTGTATHIALGKSTGTVLLYVTTCGSVLLTAAGLVDFPAWDIEISDPA